tara:strand:- start:108 stop:560 length:453 start_codon:yes stop_codon:yes gene_type:complete
MDSSTLFRILVFIGLTAFIIKTQIKKPEDVLNTQPDFFLRFKAKGLPLELLERLKLSAQKNLRAKEVRQRREQSPPEKYFCVLNTGWNLLSFGYVIAISAEQADSQNSYIALALYIKSKTNFLDGKVAGNKFTKTMQDSNLGKIEVFNEE